MSIYFCKQGSLQRITQEHLSLVRVYLQSKLKLGCGKHRKCTAMTPVPSYQGKWQVRVRFHNTNGKYGTAKLYIGEYMKRYFAVWIIHFVLFKNNSVAGNLEYRLQNRDFRSMWPLGGVTKFFWSIIRPRRFHFQLRKNRQRASRIEYYWHSFDLVADFWGIWWNLTKLLIFAPPVFSQITRLPLNVFLFILYHFQAYKRSKLTAKRFIQKLSFFVLTMK